MKAAASSTIRKMSPQFLVTDLDRSIEFYTRQLGFELEFKFRDFYAGIVRDGCSIHLKSGHRSAEESVRKRENGDLDIVFSVTDVENLYAEILGKPIEVVQPLCEQPYGKEFYIADLDGYILAFLQEGQS